MTGRSATRAVAIGLWLFLFCVYLLVYSGVIHIWDEMALVALAESLAKRGQFTINQVWWAPKISGRAAFGLDGNLYSKYGPGPALLAVPLDWIALAVPRLGQIQAMLLLNGILTALTGVLIFLCVCRLGYQRRVALATALLFGLTTIAFVYAKSLWSEPVGGFAFALAAYALLRFRERDGAGFAALGGLALGLAVTTKYTAVATLPLFAVYGFWRGAWREAWRSRRYRAGLALFAVILGVCLAALGYYNYWRFGSPLEAGYPPTETFSTPWWVGTTGLLFWPERSVFLYSPVLLAVVAAVPAFWRRHRPEAALYVLLFVTHLLIFSRWWVWWGGGCWGPRFLVPTISLLMVIAAPVVALALEEGRRWWTGSLAFLAGVSLCIQLLGAAVGHVTYLRISHFRQPGPLWTLTRWPIARHLVTFRLDDVDFAWLRTGDGVALGLVVGGVVLAAVWLCMAVRREFDRRGLAVLAVAGVVVPVLLVGLTLPRYYLDARYGRGYADTVPAGDDYRALVAHLRETERPGDALVQDSRGHAEFFLNYNKARLPWYGVRKEPSPLPDDTRSLLEQVGAEHPRVWLVVDSLPEHGYNRPVEEWFSRHAYRVDEWVFSDFARLCLYATRPLPDPDRPAHLLKMRLGESVMLAGYDLDDALAFHPGDTLHLSLLWQAIAPIEHDYTVFVQLLDESDQLRVQRDRYPVDGFQRTSSWLPNEGVRDNYGLIVPPDAPPGRYRLIVGMYRLETMERLPVTDEQGTTVGDYVLLAKVTVI